MKTKMMGLIVVALSCSFSVQADEIWDSGHHEIFDDDVYNEIWMSNDATATMFGGDVFKVETFHTSSFDMRGGEMDILYVQNDSIIYIYNGSLLDIGIIENGVVNLHAYDVVHHSTGGGHFNGWIEGKYFSNDSYFSYNLIHADSFSHINIVPEPCILSLMAIGGFIVKRKIEKKCT